MTNIALSALIIIVLLLPGAIFIRSLNFSLFSRQKVRNVSFDQVVIKGLVYSIVLHLLGVLLIRTFGYKVDFPFIYKILVGKESSEGENLFQKYVMQFCGYTLINIIASFLLAKTLRQFYYRYQFFRKLHIFNNSNYWFELLTVGYMDSEGIPGRPSETDIIILDILTDNGLVYSGYLKNYYYCPYEDKLESIVLTNAEKYQPGFGETPKCFKALAGEVIIIPFHTIKNVGVFYINSEHA